MLSWLFSITVPSLGRERLDSWLLFGVVHVLSTQRSGYVEGRAFPDQDQPTIQFSCPFVFISLNGSAYQVLKADL